MVDKTNVEIRAAIAPLFDLQLTDIFGYVLFVLGTDGHYELLSNGNQEQVEAAIKQMWVVVTGKSENALGAESAFDDPARS